LSLRFLIQVRKSSMKSAKPRIKQTKTKRDQRQVNICINCHLLKNSLHVLPSVVNVNANKTNQQYKQI